MHHAAGEHRLSVEAWHPLPRRSRETRPPIGRVTGVQDIRGGKSVPGGLKLHQYANLYFHARNPMMYKRQSQANDLCVLRISLSVAKLPGVVFADCNASSKYVRFLAPSQWKLLDFDDIFAPDWRHPNDQIRQWRHTARKCAEVLVPHSVEPKFLTGAYVVDTAAEVKLTATGFKLAIVRRPELFFR